MTTQANAQFAVNRRGGMDPEKAQAMAQKNLAASDLYVYCPTCGAKRTGTLEKIQEGCGCATERT